MGRVSSSGAALFITEATAIHPDGMKRQGCWEYTMIVLLMGSAD